MPTIQRQVRGISRVSQVRPGVDPQGVPELISKTAMWTLFTQVGGNQLLYSAEEWVRVNLRLETAGPVSVSTREDVVPALSGKGILLESNEVIFVIAKGSRLFYTAEAVNRVRVVIEPIPFAEVILRNLELGFDRIVGSLNPLSGLLSRIGARGPRPDPAVLQPQAQPAAPPGTIRRIPRPGRGRR